MIRWLAVTVCVSAFVQWQKTLKVVCYALSLPPFSPIRSLPLSRLPDFAPSAIAWELKSPDGKTAWAITDLSGKTLYEFGFSKPFWQRKELKERLLTRFGSFLSDGSWHFLYRGLAGYGLAVKKGMTIRVEARLLESWGDGREDAPFFPSSSFPFSSSLPSSSETFLVSFGFPVLPTIRSTHATSLAMWAMGRGRQGEESLTDDLFD